MDEGENWISKSYLIASQPVTTWSWFVEEFHLVSRFGECQSIEVQIEERMFLILKEWTYKIAFMQAVSGKEHSTCECTASNILVFKSVKGCTIFKDAWKH